MIPITISPRRLQGHHPKIDFELSDIQRFASPTEWLNDVCINDGAILLQLHLNTSQSDMIAIISTLALPTLKDDSLWRIARHSTYWERNLWIVPIHRYAPYEHWVLGVVNFVRGEIAVFDSLADQSLWERDVEVGGLFVSSTSTNT
jgi:Ulp1 family protease